MVRALLLLLALLLASAGAASAPPAKNRPAWAELTAEQQMVLAPLKADWESLEVRNKRKWIGIAKRYPTLKPQEQERVQKRMQDWAKLTSAQRRQARETYKNIAKAPPEKRANLRQQWAEYQALPPNERQNLVPPQKAPKKKKKQ